MSKRPLAALLALVLTFAIVAPSAFFVAPQTVHAIPVTEVGPNLLKSTISAIQNPITAIATPISAAANVAMQIDAYVLQPLAFILSGNLMKMLTAGVIAFVIGKANGTGAPQFVVDVMKSMQTVSDGQALAYLNQVSRTNSPFAGSLSSALRNDYLSKTSLSGFWAANMNSLAASSPNVPAYLAGNWSQGGIASWFALTTQSQNNPFMLHQNLQSQLASVVGPGVGGATGARATELNWGQGFMSWCGASDTATQPAGNNPDEASADTYAAGNNPDEQSGNGINPGDPCTNSDGTSGTIKTPGSVIKSTLDKVLGGQQDQIVRMGNVGPQINQILGNVASIMRTANFAASLLGGNGSGGLFGVDSASGSNSTSRLAEFQNEPGFLGVTNTQVYRDAASLGAAGSDMTKRISRYETAWNTIAAAANTASDNVTTLRSVCLSAATSTLNMDPTFTAAATAQADAAQVALTSIIEPVLAQANAASLAVATATAMVQKVQASLSSGSDTAGSTLAVDFQTLQTMHPTAFDVATAEQNAQAYGMAEASPAGSLSVAASETVSIVDQMNLIGTNAIALKTSVCTASAAVVF